MEHVDQRAAAWIDAVGKLTLAGTALL